jgi:ABC-type sugar transport system permease subunit
VLEPVLSRGPTAEKQQLLFLGIGLTLIGGANWWLFGPRVMSAMLLVLGAVALAGRLAHRAIGRGVFLSFALLAMAMGRVVSWVILVVMYVLFIAGLGSVLRLFGMNRLARDFEACKKRGSMLMDVPPVDAASFERQS